MDRDKYAKHFDDSFNFSNEVKYPKRGSKLNDIRKLQDFSCNGGIMLEPRLQEYLKKKKLYKKTGNQPCVPLEKEFQITNDDLKRIRAFLNGDKNIYEKNRFDNNDKHKKPSFPSKKFKNDERLEKIKNKKNGIVNDEPLNRGMFFDEKINYYEDKTIHNTGIMDGRDIQNFGTDMLQDYNYDNQSMDSYDDPFKSKHIYTGNKIGKHQQIGYPDQDISKHLYPTYNMENDSGPLSSNNVHNQWNPYFEYNHMQGENFDSNYNMQYGKNSEPIFNQRNEMDFENKMVIPKINENGKRNLNYSHIQPMPNMSHGNGMRDTDLETCIQFGMPSKTFKSYGYRNPDEHYFQYIENDIQNPNNVVFPIARGGISTRLNNKQYAKSYKRDIY